MAHLDDTARDWWTSAVVYQVYPRSFADSDGDGIGDLRGIIERLPHLERLGIDVMWLSPVYRSPQDDNGYDISDYEDIDPLFGTLADMDELIREAHARGIKIVMDLVVNHTSDDHAWFVDSRSSRDAAKRDWYVWRDPRPGHVGGEPGAEPTNWGSCFSGSAWAWDEATGQYYLHLFSPRQPDLNWENPQVRDAVFAMMNRWMDRGVDGFRMDVINLISKDQSFPDGERPDGALYGNAWPHVACGPRLEEFLAQMHEAVFAGRAGCLTVGEMPGVTVDDARRYTDPANREVDMVFQFEHVDLDSGPGGKWDLRPLRLVDLKASLGRWQDGLADAGWNSLYLDNHDQPRAVSRFGDDSPAWRERSAKALTTVLHLHRGTPYVYQGEEIGMANLPFASIDDCRDIESVNHYREATAHGAHPQQVMDAIRYKGRDNARTPVQWTAGPNAGFTAGTPWIAVNPDHVDVNVAAQEGDPGSVLEHTRAVIALRHELPVVARGSFEMLAPDDEQVYAFVRRLDGDELLVLANLSSTPAQVPASVSALLTDAAAGWRDATLLLTTLRDDERPVGGATGDVTGDTTGEAAGEAAGMSEELAPWEARVLRR